jgi:hypothetical protein
VADAELVRKALVPRDNNEGRWSILGQSFGGFCAVTYLSVAPNGARRLPRCRRPPPQGAAHAGPVAM